MNWMDRLNERAELMGKMLDTIGALNDMPTDLRMDSELRSAAVRCINCRDIEACKTWLQDHTHGASKAPSHCPNASLFNSWVND